MKTISKLLRRDACRNTETLQIPEKAAHENSLQGLQRIILLRRGQMSCLLFEQAGCNKNGGIKNEEHYCRDCDPCHCVPCARTAWIPVVRHNGLFGYGSDGKRTAGRRKLLRGCRHAARQSVLRLQAAGRGIETGFHIRREGKGEAASGIRQDAACRGKETGGKGWRD